MLKPAHILPTELTSTDIRYEYLYDITSAKNVSASYLSTEEPTTQESGIHLAYTGDIKKQEVQTHGNKRSTRNEDDKLRPRLVVPLQGRLQMLDAGHVPERAAHSRTRARQTDDQDAGVTNSAPPVLHRRG